jgi:hypothetical protein
MLDEADYSDKAGHELMSAAGELAVRAGWACYDSDDHDRARRLYGHALLLAGQAGDEVLAVHASVSMALQLAHLARAGRPGLARQAVCLAAYAAELARRNPSPRLHALIAAREAVARAALRDTDGFRVAITRAWRELDRGLRDDDPSWLGFVRPAEITVHEAKGLVFLGGDGAATLYRDSLRDEHLSRRNRAVYRAQLAAVLAAGGDVDQAVNEAAAVLDLLDGPVSSPRTFSLLQPVRATAGQAGMEEFCARFDALGVVRPDQESGTGPEWLELAACG